jgi:putative transcriptional regulator
MNLQGKLLIAMPGMGDPRFEKSVILMCAHSQGGAMGLIVNKPAPDLDFSSLLSQLGIEQTDGSRDIRVHFGGPVEHGRGFVLHSADYLGSDSTLRVDHRFGMTATLDILSSIAGGEGPAESILALGYSGWGPGQLEGEIAQNGWLVAEADPALVFSDDNHGKWSRALRSIGVEPLMLSAAAGRA